MQRVLGLGAHQLVTVWPLLLLFSAHPSHVAAALRLLFFGNFQLGALPRWQQGLWLWLPLHVVLFQRAPFRVVLARACLLSPSWLSLLQLLLLVMLWRYSPSPAPIWLFPSLPAPPWPSSIESLGRVRHWPLPIVAVRLSSLLPLFHQPIFSSQQLLWQL